MADISFSFGQVLGPSILRLNYWQIRLHTHLVGEIVLQVTQGLEYLHSEGICHGDITSYNVLFQLSNFDSWTEHKLEEQLGNPRKSIIHQSPGRPCYLVDSIFLFAALPGVLTKNIIIVDHSESFFVKSPPSHELHTYQSLHGSRNIMWMGRELFRHMGTRMSSSALFVRHKQHASGWYSGNHLTNWEDPFSLESSSI